MDLLAALIGYIITGAIAFAFTVLDVWLAIHVLIYFGWMPSA